MTETITTLEARLAGAATDAERVAALNALVWGLRTVDVQRALPLSEEAVRLARRAGDAAGLAPSLCLLGVCANGLSRHAESGAALEEGLALSRRIGDRFTEARCLQYIGRGRYLRSEYAAAIEAVTAAVRIREEVGDREGMGAALNLLGNIHKRLCDYEQAITCHVRGLEAREQAGDEYGVSESLINIGCVYLDRGDYAQALVFHQRCLDQARRTGSPKGEALSLANLGADFIGLGRYEEALEVSRRAAEMGRALGASEIETGPLTNMGEAHAKLGRWGEALDYYGRVLEITRRDGDRDLAAEILCLMGAALAAQGALAEARTHFAEASALAQSIGARKIAFQAAQGLSEVCRRQGDYAAALGHFEAFRRLEREVFTEEADKRAQSLVIQMEVEHHRREAEALAQINRALQQANARLEALATTDPLTGLPNHRALIAALDSQTARVRREGGSCALLFLDIDHFKSFNDTYGHSIGDAVLVEFASCVRACLREGDTLGRWGGEEFLALLPDTDAAGALQVAERVRAAVAGCSLSAGSGLHMTCSIGAAACTPPGAGRDLLVEAADRALYAAKRMGRNRVCEAGDPAVLAVPLVPDAPGHARPGRQGGVTRRAPRRAARRGAGG